MVLPSAVRLDCSLVRIFFDMIKGMSVAMFSRSDRPVGMYKYIPLLDFHGEHAQKAKRNNIRYKLLIDSPLEHPYQDRTTVAYVDEAVKSAVTYVHTILVSTSIFRVYLFMTFN
jgi:hypothetical protein